MSSANQNQQSGGQSQVSSSSGGKSGESAYRLPSNICLQHSCKLAIVQDKPVMISGEKLLVKSEDEYTSPIANIYKVETEYIIVTENSIYLISNETPSKKIS